MNIEIYSQMHFIMDISIVGSEDMFYINLYSYIIEGVSMELLNVY